MNLAGIATTDLISLGLACHYGAKNYEQSMKEEPDLAYRLEGQHAEFRRLEALIEAEVVLRIYGRKVA